VGLAYYASIRISYMLSDHMYTIPQYPVIYICACSGFFGSLVDSILGGWLQYSGKNFEIFTFPFFTKTSKYSQNGFHFVFRLQ